MELYIKKEITASNYDEFLWGSAKDLLDECNENERARVLEITAEIFDGGDIPTDEAVNDFIGDSKYDIVQSLGYEDDEHFDFCKENDLTSGEFCYRKDGDYYTEGDLYDRWQEVERACDDAMCDYPYCDFSEYLHSEFDDIETP